MRIYSSSYELMSEMGRELNSYGQTVKPKTYQNKNIEGNEDFVTKEIICQQYCLTSLQDPTWLFFYSRSREWADAEFQERIDTSDIKKVIMMIISVEIAGIALALVTEQTGSIWSSVMIHCLYNILSGESQIFHIDVAQNFPAIWMYTVNSKNMLLTGINGSVGFTASIPTMAGFTGIILMVIYDEKKKNWHFSS